MQSNQTTPTNAANADPMDPIQYVKMAFFVPFVVCANLIHCEAVQMKM